jgi:asparagine synthase (glutamine-hydrolysing)
MKKINFKNPKYKNIFDYNETSQIYFFTRSLFTSGEKFEVLKKLITINSFEKYKLPFNDLYLNTSFLEYNIYLKNQLLRDSDWASMANSIELRLPFVNKELISNAFQVKQKITRKDILKKIDKNIYRHVSKKKIGFYAPTYKKTEYHNPLKERSFTIIKKFIEINDLKN